MLHLFQHKLRPVADPKILKRGGGGERQFFQPPSSFIANARNDVYAFYKEKGGFKKILSHLGGGHPPPPLESDTDSVRKGLLPFSRCTWWRGADVPTGRS